MKLRQTISYLLQISKKLPIETFKGLLRDFLQEYYKKSVKSLLKVGATHYIPDLYLIGYFQFQIWFFVSSGWAAHVLNLAQLSTI